MDSNTLTPLKLEPFELLANIQVMVIITKLHASWLNYYIIALLGFIVDFSYDITTMLRRRRFVVLHDIM